ncbi:MAG: nucleotidyltransferase domain-containing protein [Propionibacteriales bacterium]|nr:nucleotidyltransferase domain-containing protein [Propionibacteriales bacterium]
MRSIPDSMDPTVVSAIDRRLADLARAEDVRILWAVESGSRAWGFPSPDSDYDCRFFYARTVEARLSLWPRRDVLETPLDKVFDVNGWDLSKALTLLVAGNATVVEWLHSPIVYDGDAAFRDEVLALARTVVPLDRVRSHHAHLGARHLSYLTSREVPLKKLFYALRPAFSLHWMARHAGLPPMDLPSLLAESDVSAELRTSVVDLVARKAVTRELGTEAAPEVIMEFLHEEFSRAGAEPPPSTEATADQRASIDALFRRWIS